MVCCAFAVASRECFYLEGGMKTEEYDSAEDRSGGYTVRGLKAG